MMDGVCAFCIVPDEPCQILEAPFRMDDMTLSQLLTRVCAIMTDEKESEKTVAGATLPAETHDDPTMAINQ